MAACVSPTSATQSCKSIWIIGDSYVRRGAQRAAETLGDSLGLPDICVSWFSWGGLRWKDLLPFFFHSLHGRAAPDVLLIYCGGNDMGVVSSVKLVNMMEDLHRLHLLHPHMMIIMSSITQRCSWRAGVKPAKIEKARRFVNSVMATFISSLNGAVVVHLHIRHDSPGIFLSDRVHFTNRGNDIFLTNFADCLWPAPKAVKDFQVGVSPLLNVAFRTGLFSGKQDKHIPDCYS
ncbi:uncharacterized protein [Nothobranchius furzeri]|uniref:uncharacterized protein isoform X1 n=1 Tax=Nothobranchius furzeri TaxID=105023 RepID=UPI003904B271